MRETGLVKHVNVDDVLNDVVGTMGLWQIAVLIMICFSMASPVLFPIFTNAVPRYRCALDKKEELSLASYLIRTGESSNKSRHLTFDEKARMVGPWFVSNENLDVKQNEFGCLRFKGGHIQNRSAMTSTGIDTEPCIDGYVYEHMEHQYPSTIVAEWDLVCDNSWKPPMSTSVYMLGMMVGFMSGGFIGGHLGRRKAIYLATILESASGLAVTFAPNFEVYVILRFLLSVACTIKVASVSVMVIEVTTAPNRALFSAVFSIVFNCFYRTLHAVLAMYVQQWRYLHLVIMIPCFLGILILIWTPESPRWLVSQNKDKQALGTLYKAYKVNTLCQKGTRLTENEFLHEVGYSDLPESPLKEKRPFNCGESLKGFGRGIAAPYQSAKVAKRSIISTALFCGQLCAFFGLLFYTQVVRVSVYYVAMINAITTIPGTLFSTLLYSKVKSRKRPLLTIYGIAALTLLIGGTYVVFFQPKSEIPLLVCCNITLVLLGAALNMIFIYTTELFPSSIRTQCFGNAAGLGRIGSMLCSFVNQLDYHYGHGVPVIIYGVVLILQVLLTCLLPDTDGENLADHVESNERKEEESK